VVGGKREITKKKIKKNVINSEPPKVRWDFEFFNRKSSKEMDGSGLVMFMFKWSINRTNTLPSKCVQQSEDTKDVYVKMF
jgi:hypothetical protein